MCPQRREPNDKIPQELLKKKKRTKQKQNSQSEQNFQVLTTILDIIYDAVTRWNV